MANNKITIPDYGLTLNALNGLVSALTPTKMEYDGSAMYIGFASGTKKAIYKLTKIGDVFYWVSLASTYLVSQGVPSFEGAVAFAISHLGVEVKMFDTIKANIMVKIL
jgi:hypothetical protein